MQDCLFCKIAAHQIPVETAYEDDELIAFPDINPQAPTHLLIIPKEHYPNIAEAPRTLVGSLTHAAAVLAQRMLPEGFRIVANTGANGGQTVHHVHLHILGGRPMQWPPG